MTDTMEEKLRYDKYQNELRVGDYVVCTASGVLSLGVIVSFTNKMVKVSINKRSRMCEYHAYTEQLIKFDKDQALINLLRVNFRN